MNVCRTVGTDLTTMYERAKAIKSCAALGRATKDFFSVTGDRIKSIFSTALHYLKVAYNYLKDVWDKKIYPEARHFSIWQLGILATALIPVIAIPCILGPEAIPIGIVVGAIPVLAAAALWWYGRKNTINKELTKELDATLDKLQVQLEGNYVLTEEDIVQESEKIQDAEQDLEGDSDEVKENKAEIRKRKNEIIKRKDDLNIKDEHNIMWGRVDQLTPDLNKFANTTWKENISDLEGKVKELNNRDIEFDTSHQRTLTFIQTLKERLKKENVKKESYGLFGV